MFQWGLSPARVAKHCQRHSIQPRGWLGHEELIYFVTSITTSSDVPVIYQTINRTEKCWTPVCDTTIYEGTYARKLAWPDSSPSQSVRNKKKKCYSAIAGNLVSQNAQCPILSVILDNFCFGVNNKELKNGKYLILILMTCCATLVWVFRLKETSQNLGPLRPESCQEGWWLCQILVSWDLFFGACRFCSMKTMDLTTI